MSKNPKSLLKRHLLFDDDEKEDLPEKKPAPSLLKRNLLFDDEDSSGNIQKKGKGPQFKSSGGQTSQGGPNFQSDDSQKGFKQYSFRDDLKKDLLSISDTISDEGTKLKDTIKNTPLKPLTYIPKKIEYIPPTPQAEELNSQITNESPIEIREIKMDALSSEKEEIGEEIAINDAMDVEDNAIVDRNASVDGIELKEEPEEGVIEAEGDGGDDAEIELMESPPYITCAFEGDFQQVIVVWSQDEGASWFENEMVDEGEQYGVILPDLPKGTVVWYFFEGTTADGEVISSEEYGYYRFKIA